MIVDAWSTKRFAFSSISESDRMGRAADRPDGSPILVVPLALECGHALQRDSVSQGHIRGGDIDPELDPQGPSQRELRFERAGRKDVHGIARELGDAHAARPA
jgi:hypothetical protein